MISQEDLQKIKENLPSSYVNTLYEKLDGRKSRSLIEKVLRGDRNNDDIIEAAVELAHETQLKKAALKERINTLT
jgi:uncharacterized protein YaaW (UPF0174 family)